MLVAVTKPWFASFGGSATLHSVHMQGLLRLTDSISLSDGDAGVEPSRSVA